jgi:hypothetical protein
MTQGLEILELRNGSTINAAHAKSKSLHILELCDAKNTIYSLELKIYQILTVIIVLEWEVFQIGQA